MGIDAEISRVLGPKQSKTPSLRHVAKKCRKEHAKSVCCAGLPGNGVLGYYGEPGNQTVLPATKCIQRDLDHVEVRSGALVVEEPT